MLVYVQDKDGQPLMPTNRNRAVRHWLKSGRAVVVNREPFTVRLTDRKGGYTQKLEAGIDLGTAHVGVSVVSEAKELVAAEFKLRTDISKLLTTRRMFRRSRRGRIRYRQSRFSNRKNGDELAPSVRAKIDETHKILRLVKSILPIDHWTFEIANFDIQKLINPEISGEEYQQGDQYGYTNVREYVLWRDRHTCQACHGKSKDPRLHVHHIESRKTGSDRPDNLITLCVTCHDIHHKVKAFNLKAPKSFRAPTQFNVIKAYIMRETIDLNRSATFGYITKTRRVELGLEKSHINDAFVIAGGKGQERAVVQYLGVFKRRQNRKLRKGSRSHLRNTIPSAFGFKRGDRVRMPDGQEGFIYALRTKGYFDVRRLDGEVLTHSITHRKLTRLESVKTLSIERLLRPRLKAEVSAA